MLLLTLLTKEEKGLQPIGFLTFLENKLALISVGWRMWLARWNHHWSPSANVKKKKSSKMLFLCILQVPFSPLWGFLITVAVCVFSGSCNLLTDSIYKDMKLKHFRYVCPKLPLKGVIVEIIADGSSRFRVHTIQLCLWWLWFVISCLLNNVCYLPVFHKDWKML